MTPLGASCWVQVLPIDEVTVAQHLRAAGYATHMVGKWSAAGTLRLAELSACMACSDSGACGLSVGQAPGLQVLEVHAHRARLRLAPRVLRRQHRLLHPGLALLVRKPTAAPLPHEPSAFLLLALLWSSDRKCAFNFVLRLRPDASCFTSFTPTHEPVSGWDLHSGRDVIENSTTYSTTLCEFSQAVDFSCPTFCL